MIGYYLTKSVCGRWVCKYEEYPMEIEGSL